MNAHEEISANSYLEFVVDLLRRNKGVLLSAVLEQQVHREFQSEMTDADLRLLKNGKRFKWQNNLDWAKATGTKLAAR